MYSLDIRELIGRLTTANFMSHRQLAKLSKISHSTISRWVKTAFVRKQRHPKASKLTASMIDLIKLVIKVNPSVTVNDLRMKVLVETGLSVSGELIRLVLHHSRYTYKKVYRYGLSSCQRDKIEAFEVERRSFIDADYDIIAIDETGVGRSTVFTRGWGMTGVRLSIRTKQLRAVNTSICAAVSSRGLVHYECLQGSYTKALFTAFLNNLPPINPSEKRCILLDNVAFHHSLSVQEIIAQKGYKVLFTPPYSPEYNPIEGIFASFKRLLKTGVSIEAAWKAIGRDEYANRFRHSMTYKTSF